MVEEFVSYLNFMGAGLSSLATLLRIWCFYEEFGLRTMMTLINSGLVAFAIPNILDQSECKIDRDSYIKSLFERKHLWMKINSFAMLVLVLFTILTYLAIWNTVSNMDICKFSQSSANNSERFAPFLAVTNILAMFFAYFSLSQKLFCLKHKQ